jgi:hypothetical protein
LPALCRFNNLTGKDKRRKDDQKRSCPTRQDGGIPPVGANLFAPVSGLKGRMNPPLRHLLSQKFPKERRGCRLPPTG